MGVYLNPGNELFRKYIRKKIYVDKTGLIGAVNRYMVEENNCICVARPRRFGKSYAADMLAAYYDRGCDSSDIFKDFKIAQDSTFEEYLNKYDVFQIDMANVINKTTDAETGIARLERDMCDDLREAYPDIDYRHEGEIRSMLETVHEKTGTKFVFIIDEWDCPMRERPDDEGGQGLYLDFIAHLFNGKKYLLLAYMTGILPIRGNAVGSSLNMFDEFTMMDCDPMREYFGFTEDEVKALCDECGKSNHEINDWYDGYDVGGVSIYNPYFVVQIMTRKHEEEFPVFWTDTETREDLRGYINERRYGFQDVLLRLIVGYTYPVEPDFSANGFATHGCLDDILVQLVHLGYLTYDSENRIVKVPNVETTKLFLDAIEKAAPRPSRNS